METLSPITGEPIVLDLSALSAGTALALASECARAFAAITAASGRVGELLLLTQLTDPHEDALQAFGTLWKELDDKATAAIGTMEADPHGCVRALDGFHADGRRTVNMFADAFALSGMNSDHQVLLTGYAMTVAAIEDHRSTAIAELLGLSGQAPSALN